MNRFDGFSVNVFLDEDGDWLAHFCELPEVSAFAKTPEKALHELELAWALYKESCLAIKKPIPVPARLREFSGTFNVRIDKRVHKSLAIEAENAGISLNALVAQKLYASTHNINEQNKNI